MFEVIFSGVVFGGCALLMIIIGIVQARSKKPVGFYSGVKPPKAAEITDVDAWNKKHGMMWIIYGLIILACWGCGLLLGDSVLTLIPYCAGLILPIFFMMAYHNNLIGKYVVYKE